MVCSSERLYEKSSTPSKLSRYIYGYKKDHLPKNPAVMTCIHVLFNNTKNDILQSMPAVMIYINVVMGHLQ